LQYAAPELFNAPGPVFSTAADIWAFGVVVFALVTARLPFNEGLDMKTTEKILEGKWDEEVVRVSYSAQDGSLEDTMALLRGCLSVDVEKRWTIHDILGCAWLRDHEQKFEDVSRPWLEAN
jgi:serine/threonine protein kinase